MSYLPMSEEYIHLWELNSSHCSTRLLYICIVPIKNNRWEKNDLNVIPEFLCSFIQTHLLYLWISICHCCSKICQDDFYILKNLNFWTFLWGEKFNLKLFQVSGYAQKIFNWDNCRLTDIKTWEAVTMVLDRYSLLGICNNFIVTLCLHLTYFTSILLYFAFLW